MAVIDIDAESYRLEEAKELSAARTKAASRNEALIPDFTGELHRHEPVLHRHRPRSSPVNFTEFPRVHAIINTPKPEP